MQKILELNGNHFMTGIAQGSQIDKGGLFQFLNQITPFSNLAVKGDDAGVLQAIESPVDISGAVIVDTPISFAINISSASAAKGYFLGDAGNFYQTDESGDNAPTNLRSGANVIANVSKGLIVYKGKCLYAQLTQIGEWNMSGSYPTGWTDNKYTGLQSHSNHYMHEFNEYCWVADKDRISKIDGSTIELNVLDFPTGYLVHHITNDGRYLVITLTTNFGMATITKGVKIVWWDMVDDTWNWEVEIPDNYATGCIPTNDGILVVGKRGLYKVAFGVTGYQKILWLASADGGKYDQPYSIGYFDGIPAWLSESGGLYTYGQMMPGQPKILLNPVICPFQGIFNNYKSGRIYFGCTNALHRWTFASAVTADNLDGRTIFLDLKRKWTIRRIKIVFSASLATNDSLFLELHKSLSDYRTWGTYSYATYGAVNEVSIYNEYPNVELLALNLRFSSGNPRIRRIVIYGDPAPND
jgi:hypothetical protein